MCTILLSTFLYDAKATQTPVKPKPAHQEVQVDVETHDAESQVDMTNLRKELKPRNDQEKKLFMLSREPLRDIFITYSDLAFPLKHLRENDPHFIDQIASQLQLLDQRNHEISAVIKIKQELGADDCDSLKMYYNSLNQQFLSHFQVTLLPSSSPLPS